MTRERGSPRAYVTALASLILTIVVTASSCTNSTGQDKGSSTPAASRSASGHPISDQLFRKVAAAGLCAQPFVPTDVLQDPSKVLFGSCDLTDANKGADKIQMWIYQNSQGIRFRIQSEEIGNGSNTVYVVGPYWVLMAPPTTAATIQGLLKGQLFDTQSSAVKSAPGIDQESPYVNCVLFYTSYSVHFGATGKDQFQELDKSFPGLQNNFDSDAKPIITATPSFKSGDDEKVSADLVPHADVFRAGCGRLFPQQ